MGSEAGSSDLIADGRLNIDSFLEHYGIPGMKWGRRRSDKEIAESKQQVEVTTKAGKGVVKTSGGKKLQASEDAINAKASRQRAKASTTDALSNQELQALVTRMNLEQQYSRLAGPQQKGTVARGLAFVSKHLSDDKVNVPIRDLLTDIPQTSGRGVSAFDKVTLGATVLNPVLNKK